MIKIILLILALFILFPLIIIDAIRYMEDGGDEWVEEDLNNRKSMGEHANETKK